MQTVIYNLNKQEVGHIELDEGIFSLDVRPDIIKRVIDWQLAKRQAGTHKTKTITEVSGTTKKPFKQKGTGNARQGSLRSVHMRGGGVSHGPQVRSHAFKLPKKIRSLGLKHAFSAKSEQNALFIVKDFSLQEAKTKILKDQIRSFGFKSYFVIDDLNVNQNFLAACSNLHNVNAVPQVGANVYDIIRHECLIISENALNTLVARLK